MQFQNYLVRKGKSYTNLDIKQLNIYLYLPILMTKRIIPYWGIIQKVIILMIAIFTDGQIDSVSNV